MTLWLCALLTLFTALIPCDRLFRLAEISYNEGWNIYNAATVAAGQPLYPAKYGWTSVNYPMLSFAVLAQLHRVTHEYLFTARILSLLSLIAGCVLVGAIVYQLTRARLPSVLAGLFTAALFCASADAYVGVDDPQIFSQVFFLAGLWCYVRWRSGVVALALAAFLFVLGGFIKQNPVDFPIAVLIDLALVSRWRAAGFAGAGLLLAAIGFALNIHFGGPHFADQLLAPRAYSWLKAAKQSGIVLGPVLLPFALAAWTALRARRDPQRRILALLLTVSLCTGGYFSGGNGVAVNALFSTLLATAMLIGILFASMAEPPGGPLGPNQRSGAVSHLRRLSLQLRTPAVLPVIVFAWLLIPMAISGNVNARAALARDAEAEHDFAVQVEMLRAHPGPALCEDLLLCFAAGKPYLYDPFNATRLITQRRLDPEPLLIAISQQRFSTIQLSGPTDEPIRRDRFARQVLDAIERAYTPALNAGENVIYVPSAAAYGRPQRSRP